MRRRFRYFIRLYQRWRNRFQTFRHYRRYPRGNKKYMKSDVGKWKEDVPFADYDFLDFKWQVYSRPYGDITWRPDNIQTQNVPQITKSYYFKYGVRYEIDLPSHIKPHHHHARCMCMGSTSNHPQSKPNKTSTFKSYSREVRQRFIMNEWQKHNAENGEESVFLGSDSSLRRHNPSSKHSKNTRQYKAKTFHGCPDENCSCQVVKAYTAEKEAERKDQQQEKWERQAFKEIEVTMPQLSPAGTVKPPSPQPFRLHYRLLESAMSSNPPQKESEMQDKSNKTYFGRSFSYNGKDTTRSNGSNDTRIFVQGKTPDRVNKKSRTRSVPNDAARVLEGNKTKETNESHFCQVEGCSCHVVEDYSRQMEKRAQERKLKELRRLAKDNEANMKKESGQDSAEKGTNDSSKGNRQTINEDQSNEEDNSKSLYQKIFALGKKKQDKSQKKEKRKKRVPVLFERRPDAEETRYKNRPSNKITKQTSPEISPQSKSKQHFHEHDPCSCKSVQEYTRKKDKEYIEQWKKDVAKATGSANSEKCGNDSFESANMKRTHKLQRHHSEPSRRTIRKSLTSDDPEYPDVDIVIHKGYRRGKSKNKQRASSTVIDDGSQRFHDSGVFSSDPFELGPWVLPKTHSTTDKDQTQNPHLEVQDWDPVKNVFADNDASFHTNNENINQSKWTQFDDEEAVDWNKMMQHCHSHVPDSNNTQFPPESISFEENREYPHLGVEDWTPVKERYVDDSNVDPTPPSNTKGLKESNKRPSAVDIYNQYANQFRNDTAESISPDTVFLPPEEWTPVKPRYGSTAPDLQGEGIVAQPLEHLIPGSSYFPVHPNKVTMRQSNISRDSGCFSISSPTEITQSLEYSIPEETSMNFASDNVEMKNVKPGTQSFKDERYQGEIPVPYEQNDHYIAHNENALNEMSVVRKVKSAKSKSKRKTWTSLGAKLRKADYEELHEVPNDHRELYDEWEKHHEDEEIDTRERIVW